MKKVRKILFVGYCFFFLLFLVSCVFKSETPGFINEIAFMFGRIDEIEYCRNKGWQWDPEKKECTPALPPVAVTIEPVGPANSQQNPPEQTSDEEIAKPTPNPQACLVYHEAIEWWYEDVSSSSGTGGTTCTGKLTFQNNSNEAALFRLYTIYDNGTMKGASWQGRSVISLEKASVQVGFTSYKDGTVTYNKVPLFLAVRDIPACFYMLTEESEQRWYDELATVVDELPCP